MRKAAGQVGERERQASGGEADSVAVTSSMQSLGSGVGTGSIALAGLQSAASSVQASMRTRRLMALRLSEAVFL